MNCILVCQICFGELYDAASTPCGHVPTPQEVLRTMDGQQERMPGAQNRDKQRRLHHDSSPHKAETEEREEYYDNTGTRCRDTL